MKKLICIILCSIMLVSVPFKGYASSAVFFGMSEEVVLAFIASLLGLQAKEEITSYNDLVNYNDSLKYGLTEYISGTATSMQIGEWIGQAAIGKINTDSVIWQKLYEFCVDNYVQTSASTINIPSSNLLSQPETNYSYASNYAVYNSNGTLYQAISAALDVFACAFYSVSNNSRKVLVLASSNANAEILRGNSYVTLSNSYTYDDKVVYYNATSYGGSVIQPITDSYNISRNDAQTAWLMVYGGYSFPVEGVGEYSSVFDDVLTSYQKEDIIDGTSVLQLYNPAVAQNGLYIVPDPEDPDDIVIPAMLTADWYNFLQQFGSGAESFVSAYNALNAVEGVSTGAINGLYNNLGIASAVNSAGAAAQGTLSLTDNNIFPQVSTVADAVTGVIPGVLTPATPDSGITNDSDQGLYKLPDLRDFFPFCIPFDFIDLLSCFVAEPETPEFVIALSDGSHLADHEISLESFDNIASIVRILELSLFILGLMLITRNLIRG